MQKIKAELTFPSGLKDEAIIWHLCKEFDMILNIVEASFSTETGWAILIFEGIEDEINRAFTYLKDKRIKIDNIERLL
ncbi:MAG: NIL domain-containing protein [Candidatus Omnitrophica bacterium]|nr:NIL domain-containing protein [Candidatus Omnitrophota bacterium]MBU4345784.1 NIL domain-containing protein [Candidatus Omnitrophota bacterium]MBU4473457.1 NIL domain-containing protein [Candidatus Omnitrophota bacterium]MCG2706208.1 NIL domain-containing protein [Candidatus Omnitrophota bacterium]